MSSDSELTVEERLDRLEKAVVQGILPSLGVPTPRRGAELHELVTRYVAERDAAEAAAAASDPHNLMRRR